MAKASKKFNKEDQCLDVKELTHLFYQYYQYHKDYQFVEYANLSTTTVDSYNTTTISRFDAFTRLAAMQLGSKKSSVTVACTEKPLSPGGYFSLFLEYSKLPYKALFSNSKFIKTRIDRKFYNIMKLTPNELVSIDKNSMQNPAQYANDELGNLFSGLTNEYLQYSKDHQTWQSAVALAVTRDGIVPLVHDDTTDKVKYVSPLDFITEPNCNKDPIYWSSFFVINKIPVSELKDKLNKNAKGWNKEAIKWAVEECIAGKGIIAGTANHASSEDNVASIEYSNGNTSIKSFIDDKIKRVSTVDTYFGNMHVIEAYTLNKDNKVNKTILWASDTVKDAEMTTEGKFFTPTKDTKQDDNGNYIISDEVTLDNMDVLYLKENAYPNMRKAVSVLVANNDEPTIDRQRGMGHEILPYTEVLMDLDQSILHQSDIISTIFYKEPQDPTNTQSTKPMDTTKAFTLVKETIAFIPNPIRSELQSLVSIRSLYLQQVATKLFLSGIDNIESLGKDSSEDAATMKLLRDGVWHKQNIAEFAKQLTSVYEKIISSLLENFKNLKNNKPIDNTYIKYNICSKITKQYNYDVGLFVAEEEEILEDTHLPYWMTVAVTHNGGSHFGAAEYVILSKIKHLASDTLSKKQMSALNRSIITSLMSSQDAMDILGNVADENVTDSDQVYQASVETAVIMGSVDTNSINFVSVPTNPEKDDDVTHLTESHNPKMQELLKDLQDVTFSPEEIANSTDSELDTKTTKILKLAALANHSSGHLEGLSLYGNKRRDINQLKEETNAILQQAEALLNNLQVNLRAILAKKQEKEAKLMSLSPANAADKEKNQLELMKLQAGADKTRENSKIAAMIQENVKFKIISDKVEKRADREAKKEIAQMTADAKKQDKSKKDEKVSGSI